MEHRFEVPVLVAAVLVIPVVVIEEADAGEPWSTIATVGNWAIWLVFAAEPVAALAVVPNRWEWAPHHPQSDAAGVPRGRNPGPPASQRQSHVSVG